MCTICVVMQPEIMWSALVAPVGGPGLQALQSFAGPSASQGPALGHKSMPTAANLNSKN